MCFWCRMERPQLPQRINLRRRYWFGNLSAFHTLQNIFYASSNSVSLTIASWQSRMTFHSDSSIQTVLGLSKPFQSRLFIIITPVYSRRFRISRTFNDVQQTSEEAPRNFLLPIFIRMKYADGVSILQSLRNIVISVLFLSFSARSNIFARQVQYPDWEPSCAFPPGFSYIHMEPALPEGSVGLNQFA